MIVTIAKQFTFDAAHFIPTVPVDHKCHRMHGHTYGVELRLRGPTELSGFCSEIDYADVTKLWQPIHDLVDHRVLNEVSGLEIPTTENLVYWLIYKLRVLRSPDGQRVYGAADFDGAVANAASALQSVRVSESSTTWCEGFVADHPSGALARRSAAPGS